MIQSFISFIAGFFREGSPESFARGISFVITTNVLAWDGSYLHATGKLPDGGTLAAQVLFMTAFYIGGKGISAYSDAKSQSSPTEQQKL